MPKSKHQIPGRVRLAYEFIKAHRDLYSVQMMCRVLEVAPSGYYEWVLQPVSNRAQEGARLLRLIRASFTASHGIYGAPRVFLDLREAGKTYSKHRVARLMRQANLRARIPHPALGRRHAELYRLAVQHRGGRQTISFSGSRAFSSLRRQRTGPASPIGSIARAALRS